MSMSNRILRPCIAMQYRVEVDLWSVGCIFGELLLGKAPLQGRDENSQVSALAFVMV